jgi:hypothetical protein
MLLGKGFRLNISFVFNTLADHDAFHAAVASQSRQMMNQMISWTAPGCLVISKLSPRD